MTPAIRVSILVHAAGVIVLALAPGMWPWIAAALVANHLVWPPHFHVRGRLLETELPLPAAAHCQVCLTFDDGPHRVTPRVLELLGATRPRRASASAKGEGAPGDRARNRAPPTASRTTATVIPTFAFYGISLLRREIERTQATVAAIAGARRSSSALRPASAARCSASSSPDGTALRP
jgi:hypothetical protein